MPFRSQAQWKWAFATNQDFARKWARETPGGKRRFARLSKKIGMKAAMDEYMTTFKEREFVRDDSGKFASKPGGGLDKAAAAQRVVDKLAKPKKGGGGGSAKPKKTEAQRNAERATEARDNAMSVLDKVGFDASDYELLSDRGAQDANDPSVQRLIEKGLMERVGDKVYVSALGKKITAAAERGDADGAQETLDRDAAKRQEREAKRQEREAKRQAAEEEKKKPKGGGGGGGKKPAEEKKPVDTSALKKRFDSAIARLSQRLEREKDGKRAEAIKRQIEKLTAQRNRLGKTTKADGHTPPQGVRDAAKRGLELRSQFGRGGTPVGIARARDLSNGKRVSDSTIKRMVSFFARHAVDKRPGWGDPANPTNGYIAHLLWGGDAGKAWANKVARQLDASTKELNCSMVEDDDMSIPDGLIQRVKSLTYKHGKHDQKSHGRKTARRAAYQAAYSAAKAEGKSPVEARDAAKAASRVELEKRIAERRAEVAQRAAERAAKRGVIPKVDERKVELPPEPLGPPPVVVQPQVVTTPEETFRPRKSSSPSVRSGGRGQRISGTKLEQELERVNYWIDKARRLGQTDRVDALIKERDGLRTEITKRREAAQARSAKRVEDARDSWYRRQMAQANLRQKQSGDGFMVYKSSDGYRWVAISSTAYLDRDKEIVSTKALKQAVERAEATGEYGPLRFWHVPGIDIGTTDYQALSNDGKFLVESGVITDEAIAQSLMKRGKGWQVSIGFEHPRLEPVDGVFENIKIFERSITPPGRAANPMTGFSMVEDDDMSIPDGLIQRVKSLTYKHGKHDQKSHGRKTARRAAYQAAYSAAKAEGKSPVEARDAAKAASRVELEKRIAERRAEVAQRAAERAAKRGQQSPQADRLAGIESVIGGRKGEPIVQKDDRTFDENTTPISSIYTGNPSQVSIKITDEYGSYNENMLDDGRLRTSFAVHRFHVTKDGEVFFSDSDGKIIGVTDVPLFFVPPTLGREDAEKSVRILSQKTGIPLKVGVPTLTKGPASDPLTVKLRTRGQSQQDKSVGIWNDRFYINDPRIPSNAKVYYDSKSRSWGSRDADPSLVSQIVADYS